MKARDPVPEEEDKEDQRPPLPPRDLRGGLGERYPYPLENTMDLDMDKITTPDGAQYYMAHNPDDTVAVLVLDSGQTHFFPDSLSAAVAIRAGDLAPGLDKLPMLDGSNVLTKEDIQIIDDVLAEEE